MFKPYKHQQDAIDFITAPQIGGRNALLWHEVGLGKTMAAVMATRTLLARIRHHHDPAIRSGAPKALVVLPIGLLPQWRSEVNRLAADMSMHLLYLPYSQLHRAKVLLTYYDIRVLICDESHMLKTTNTKRIENFKLVLSCLAGSAKKFAQGKTIFLTGTPIPNNGAEMYTTWATLSAPNLQEAVSRLNDPKKFLEWTALFTNRELKEIPKNKHTKARKGFGAPKGLQNEEKMHQVIAPFVHFRTADECLDLPEKQEIPIDLGLDDDTLLDKADISKPAEYMSLVERLARAKTPFALEWVGDFIANNPDERLVVFCPYMWPLNQLKEKFPDDTTMFVGDLSIKQRDRSVQLFNAGEKRILLGTYGAMSTGLNLQAARQSLYLGYPWSPKTVSQAIGRTRRSGQRFRTMHFFLLSGENDRRILGSLRQKEKGISLIENTLANANADDLIMDLI